MHARRPLAQSEVADREPERTEEREQRVGIETGKAGPQDRNGDIRVDTNKSMAVYRQWLAMTKPAPGPNGLRRPLWLKRPLKPHISMFYLTEEKTQTPAEEGVV